MKKLSLFSSLTIAGLLKVAKVFLWLADTLNHLAAWMMEDGSK